MRRLLLVLLCCSAVRWARATVQSDNCAAIAAGFPVELAAQLCVTCPVVPTLIATSSAAEIAAVAAMGGVAVLLLIFGIILCCVLYYWLWGTRRTLEDAQDLPPPPPGPDDGLVLDFQFDDGTGAQATQASIDFQFDPDEPLLPPGVSDIVFEQPGQSVLPGAVVNFAFAEPGGQAGTVTTEFVSVSDPAQVGLLAPVPASAPYPVSRALPPVEQRGRSRFRSASPGTGLKKNRKHSDDEEPRASGLVYKGRLESSGGGAPPVLSLGGAGSQRQRKKSATASVASAVPFQLQ